MKRSSEKGKGLNRSNKNLEKEGKNTQKEGGKGGTGGAPWKVKGVWNGVCRRDVV